MPRSGHDVIVVGGGVTGLSAAWWLAKAGVDVAVLEKGLVGWEASGRNGGICAERSGEPEVTPLGAESLRLWPTMDEQLGYPTEYVQGTLHVAMTEEQMRRTEEMRRREQAAGVVSELVDAAAVRRMWPPLSPEVRGGVYHPHAGHANPQRSSQAFAWALLDRGGHIYQHTQVTGVSVERDRVVAVETDRGRFETDFLVCAAGPQTGHLARMAGAFVPVAPGMLEMVVTAPVSPMSPSGMSGNGLYGRQTLRGNLAYGGGALAWADVGLQTPRKPTSPLVRNIVRRLFELLPGLGDVPIIRSWAGAVEVTPDNLPIVDRLEHPHNMVVATMSSHGFGLSPATGRAIAQLVRDAESPLLPAGLSLTRFSRLGPSWRERYGWTPQGAQGAR